VAQPAPTSASPIEVTGAWARAATLAGDGSRVNTAAYLVIQHHADVEDALIGAESPVADATEVHRTEMDAGVMRMRPAGDVPIPAGSTLILEPGGLHVMLIGLRQELKEGASIPLALEFRRAGTVSIDVPVRSIAAAMTMASPSPAGTMSGGR
jgi:hypothetical protein